ncbi:chymotrypsin inhibitor-like [Cylas formicarius]|uniref:chymotrypsin inhibitor-like n=1 Tax=Cylas formicarius TaxID=197179 RepID=UPI0029585782|nr:chymotrypsin inhibitor-like [Cylas formicarius]
MSALTTILFSVMFVFSVKGDDVCGPYGRVNTCASRCDPVPSCSVPNPPPTPPGTVCTTECVVRCQCNRGAVVDSTGKCILLSQCA